MEAFEERRFIKESLFHFEFIFLHEASDKPETMRFRQKVREAREGAKSEVLHHEALRHNAHLLARLQLFIKKELEVNKFKDRREINKLKKVSITFFASFLCSDPFWWFGSPHGGRFQLSISLKKRWKRFIYIHVHKFSCLLKLC